MRNRGQRERNASRSAEQLDRDNLSSAGNSKPAGTKRTLEQRSSTMEVARWKQGNFRRREGSTKRRGGPSLGEADLEEGNRGRGRREAAERRFERVERDVAEDDPAEACPEAVPAAGEDAGARGGASAGEAGEDEQEKIVGEGADVVWSALVAEG
jgi:hypothetical protein